MMLPSGWGTGTEGLSRAAQLRLLGNSVVPEQAVHALEILLGDITALAPLREWRLGGEECTP
ncbi:hypothetical protein AB0D14_38135 [Streptomyces sp. NPDC048484]|uniref:hypothetical protein n=1 Tax=Streptomyces sp. NPDC048484 TaxID=3155146 RepID=UPI0034459D1B